MFTTDPKWRPGPEEALNETSGLITMTRPDLGCRVVAVVPYWLVATTLINIPGWRLPCPNGMVDGYPAYLKFWLMSIWLPISKYMRPFEARRA